MSSRPQFNPYAVIVNGDMSGNITSAVTIIQKLSMLSYSYSWAGTTPVGTISVEVSNDYSVDATGNVKNAGTWSAISVNLSGSAVSSIPVSGNTGKGFIDIDQCAAYAIRTVYTRTSGTGTLQSVINGKVS
jgi:hypothetical protein